MISGLMLIITPIASALHIVAVPRAAHAPARAAVTMETDTDLVETRFLWGDCERYILKSTILPSVISQTTD